MYGSGERDRESEKPGRAMLKEDKEKKKDPVTWI